MATKKAEAKGIASLDEAGGLPEREWIDKAEATANGPVAMTAVKVSEYEGEYGPTWIIDVVMDGELSPRPMSFQQGADNRDAAIQRMSDLLREGYTGVAFTLTKSGHFYRIMPPGGVQTQLPPTDDDIPF